MIDVNDIYPAERVSLREVGLRDGLQLVENWPSTDAKREWLTKEHAAGVRYFEIGSFLPPARFPQFADVGDMVDAVAKLADCHGAVVVLNERGVDDALASGVDEIVCVVSATEAHSQANARRTRAEAIGLVRQAAAMREAAGADTLINVGISMAFGCSIAGEVAQAEVLRLAEACLQAGADLVGVADTVGYAGPRQVGEMASAMERLCAARPFIVHLHDTRGMGIANASAALDTGARILDASLGGLGGCPFAPGATGNIVFEDLAFLCERKGFRTGIDIEALGKARIVAEAAMEGESFHGALARAGVPENLAWMA